MKKHLHFYIFFVALLIMFSLNIAIVSAYPVLSISHEDNQKANIAIENCREKIIGFSILLYPGQECSNFTITSNDFIVLSARVNNSNNIVVKGITASDLKGDGLKLFMINSSCDLTQLKILNATIYGHGKEWLIQNGITQTIIKKNPYESDASHTTPSLPSIPTPTSNVTPSSTLAPTVILTPSHVASYKDNVSESNVTPISYPAQTTSLTTSPLETSSLDSSPTTIPSQYRILSFGGTFTVIAIISLLMAAYLVLRRRK